MSQFFRSYIQYFIMRIIRIIGFVMVSNIIYAQSGFNVATVTLSPVDQIIYYSLDFLEDSSGKDSKQEKMMLLVGKQVSMFTSYNYYLNDIAMKNLKNESAIQEWMMNPQNRPPTSRFLYKVYKNYPDGKITFTDYVLPNFFKYEEDKTVAKWTLLTDTATISGYTCQKATTSYGGRIWVAWFSIELPISDGPYKFGNLPGLIVKLHDTRHHYTFKMSSIERPEEQLYIELDERNYVKTTREKFMKAEDSFREDIMNRIGSYGLSQETRQQAKARISRQNNPIELDRSK